MAGSSSGTATDSDSDDVRYEKVADALYAAHPSSFVAGRDEAVKTARADKRRELVKRLQGLRRPTATAWAINLLVRERPGDVRDLTELGEAIADAQRRGDGEALRRMASRRRTLTSELVEQSRRLAAASDQAVDEYEIEQTLNAAVADPEAAARVLSGRLVSPESYAGFGPVGFPTADAAAPATAPPTPPRSPAKGAEEADSAAEADAAEPDVARAPARSRAPAEKPAKSAAGRRSRQDASSAAATAQRAAAEEAAADALDQLRTATAEHEEAADALTGATAERERLAELVEEAERQLEDLERRLAAADIALRKARRTASVAETRFHAAQRAAETAERRLQRYE